MKNSLSFSDAKKWRPISEFRHLVAGITVDPPGAVFGPRQIYHYEFIWIMEGEATIHFDKQVIRAREGTVLLRRSGVRDYYEWSATKHTIHAYVHFDLDQKRETLVSKVWVPSFRVFPPNDIFRPLFGYLLGLEEKKEPLRSRLMLPVLDVMLSCYVTGEVGLKAKPANHLPDSMEKVLEAIRSNTAQTPPPTLRLKELAMTAHTTPENLCRLFKKYLNLGPLEYTKMTKLDRAANQLLRTTLSLKEIALATGFYDAYHLSRSFKQVYGLSPKEFREAPFNEWLTQKNPIIRTQYTPEESK
jgi:AraC family transcriptional regulator